MAPGSDVVVERILAAAEAEFERVGLRRASMGRVAQVAEIGRATLYRRFPDKAALVDAVLQRHLTTSLARLETLMAAIPDPRERLVEGFAETIELIREDRLLQRLLETEPETVLPIATTQGAVGIALARDFLADQLRRSGLDASGHLDEAAEIAVRLVHSLMLTPSDRLGTDRQASRDLARRLLLPALLPR
ncbi:TetR/AcrR family transcriptional regulator [Nocardioides limicola]|uniref:TetR/AcrR family transcriptional regulator n=1 Tax=Nocardioides limicola TaxID=2803368 RepID=UPI00193C6CF3|nr:TetR family transcriptional regulator [Nocardioides sp. DJM-14]